jgi:tetratricopeptide (TPR) repeat protein
LPELPDIEAYATAGELEPALAAFCTAVRLAPSSALYRLHRGDILRRLDRHVEAIDDLSEAIRLDPRFDKALNMRADCYRATRQMHEAIADLSRAIEINPLATYYLNRGIALGIEGRFEESVNDCSAAIQRNPDLLAAYGARALSYTNLKRYNLARADLTHLERMGSRPDPSVLELLEKESPRR